jgi:regulator of protease activity HflC (stomatin/prohibitin superfamily)
MADDPSTPSEPVAGVGSTVVVGAQLTQARVPLDRAGEAFSVPDSSGRLPIVVLPDQPFRIRNEFVIVGVILVVVGLILDLELPLRGGLVAIGAISVFLGVFQSFIVAVPEGAQALLLRSGRYSRTVGAGRHVVPPWIVVSHLVTIREIPFASAALGTPTRDDVRIDLELLLTFRITAPDRFVFAISAPDFDEVCLAATLDASRLLVRAKDSDGILDLGEADTASLRATIGEALAGYGVEIGRVVVTGIHPPLEFMASRESRRLAVVQREEQTDRHALEERLLADRQALERQRVTAQREHIELDAANEALRLQHLEERLAAYPHAARWDVETERLSVARALAGNTRAMVQVGSGGDIADALLLHTLTDGDEPAGDEPGGAPRPPGRRARSTRA